MESGTVVGAYRLVQQIGEGGMGTVWLAEHAMLGRRAAIKLLHPMFSARSDIVTRFFNEARAATAIADPGIVQIFDFGHQPDGVAYIAMEMLDGEPLDRRLTRLGRLTVTDALRIIRQVASTLGVAHARGIVHRDLKPENIYLVRDPEVAGGERAKILDFGIAKLLNDAQVKTNTSAVMGTPAYMSPEQCRGAGRVDQRADVYSLGCMIYALCTGAPPFDVEGAGEMIAMHLREPPPRMSSRVRDLPPELDALALRCIAKDPEQRYASGSELAVSIGVLLGAVSGHHGTAPDVHEVGRVRAFGQAATTLSSSSGVVGTAPRARSSRIVAVGAGLIVAGGIVVAVAMQSSANRGIPAVGLPSSAAVAGLPELHAMSPGGTATTDTPATPRAVPPAAAPAARPDPGAELAARMTTVLTGFTAWSREHVGAPCPTAAQLATGVVDPWGHPLEITCSDQPANQIIGAISAGPDGVAGTQDDIGSWQLGDAVTNVVRGTRWRVAAPAVPVPAATPRSAPTPAAIKPAPAPPTAVKRTAAPARPASSDDDIPRER